MGKVVNRAVFLDRDGVLTVERKRISLPGEMEVVPYARECVQSIHDAGYLAIVVTNQSGIARGLFTEEELQDANHRLIEQTGVDDVFYCPHHPEGIVSRYRVKCNCRKPCTGMINAACDKYDIDRHRSYMVGDRQSDIETGIKSGLTTVLLESGYGSDDLDGSIIPDHKYADMKEFVSMLQHL